MMDKEARRSEEMLGELYYIKKNKDHEFFFCDRCRRDRRTNPIYYPSSNVLRLICSECYGKLINEAERNKEKTAELLPVGTTVYVGKKAHSCKTPDFIEQYYRILDGRGKDRFVKLYKCKTCGNIIIKGNKYDSGVFLKYNVLRSKHKGNVQRSTMSSPCNDRENSKEAYRKFKIQDFITRTTIKKCFIKKHEVEDIKCSVRVMHDDYSVTAEMVPALYCRTCNKYYILESEYQSLSKLGVILCNVVEETYWNSSGKEGFNLLNEESLLHKMGYNVSAQDNLKQFERQRILRAAIDNGLLTKTEIVSHLDYLIRRSQNRRGFSDAVEKWKADRDYVRVFSPKDAKMNCYEAGKITHRVRKD